MAYDDAGGQLSQTTSNLFDGAGRTESRTWYEQDASRDWWHEPQGVCP